MTEANYQAARSGAAITAKAMKNKIQPSERQLWALFGIPCTLAWSNGTTSTVPLTSVFQTEEDYKRYRKYKSSGAPYPVRVAAIRPTTEEWDEQSNIFPESTRGEDFALLERICQGFTEALQEYLEETTP